MSRAIYSKKALYIVMCIILLSLTIVLVHLALPMKAFGEPVSIWLTTSDLSNPLAPSNAAFAPDSPSNATTITLNEKQTYQQIDGFGASFTDSSAWLVYNKMSSTQRSTLMANLFDPTNGIGLSFLRQPMGASDLSRPASDCSSCGEYTYDDMPAGQTDPTLANFSISHDTAYIIPVLKQALQINPNLKIIATPWSPPAWMKTTGSLEGGNLDISAYDAFANYFVKYIQAYQQEGVPIYAISIQNEPTNQNATGFPNMLMSSAEQTNFIKNNLGQAFSNNHIGTKILVYDHNWDNTSYASSVLGDATASSYVAGTAWHCYAGTSDAQTTIRNLYPAKETYETECSGGSWEGSNDFKNIMELIINSTRNWSRTVVRWGMALDQNNGPNLGTGSSCTTCRGVVTVDQNTGNVTYNSDYWGLGHVSKFVMPGAYRIASTSGMSGIEDVAFKNPDGSKVLIAYNSAPGNQTLKVQWGTESFSYTLPAGAAATFKWTGTQPSPRV